MDWQRLTQGPAGPTGVAVDAAMNVYLADPGAREVRKLPAQP